MSSSVIETIKEVVSNMNSGLYDFTVDGKCSECGSCCSNFIPISSKEIKQIKCTFANTISRNADIISLLH